MVINKFVFRFNYLKKFLLPNDILIFPSFFFCGEGVSTVPFIVIFGIFAPKLLEFKNFFFSFDLKLSRHFAGTGEGDQLVFNVSGPFLPNLSHNKTF